MRQHFILCFMGVVLDIGGRFKRVRNYFELSQGDMSLRVGLSKNAWQTYELGKSSPGTSVFMSLLDLGISIDWLLGGTGTMIRSASHDFSDCSFLPLYDSVNGDSDVLGMPTWLAFKNDWLRLMLRTDPSNLAMFVNDGDSMIPTINPGDTLVVDRSRRTIVGDGIYLLNMGTNYMVKRLQSMLDGRLKIISDNPVYETQVIGNGDVTPAMLRIAGRVLWHGERL